MRASCGAAEEAQAQTAWFIELFRGDHASLLPPFVLSRFIGVAWPAALVPGPPAQQEF
jgi:hypothetical protein